MKCYLCLYQNDDNFIILKEGNLEDLDQYTTKFKTSSQIKAFHQNVITEQNNVHYNSVRIVSDKDEMTNKRTKVSVLYQEEEIILSHKMLLFEISTKLFLPEYQPIITTLKYSPKGIEAYSKWQTLKNITAIELSNSSRKEYKELQKIITSSKTTIKEKTKAAALQEKVSPYILTENKYNEKCNYLRFCTKKALEALYPKYNNTESIISKTKLLEDLQNDFINTIKNKMDTREGYFWARKIYSKIKSHEKKNNINISITKEDEKQPILVDDFIREEETNFEVSTKVKVKKYEEEL